MLISLEHYETSYQRLISSSADTPLVIYVATDVDALCALRVLTSLLQRDNVRHKIIPISGYPSIAQQQNPLVFINCGGQVDIQELAGSEQPILIVDSHRPFNLYNVCWNEQVLCLDDGDLDIAELREAFEEIEFGSDSEASEDSEDDAGIDDPDAFVRRQEQRAGKRHRRNEHRGLIEDYYRQGTYFGQSCAMTLLQVAEQLGYYQPPPVDMVWWSIVGSTSQYVLQQIDNDGYAEVVRRMQELVRRLSVNQKGSPITANGTNTRPATDDLPSDMLDSQLNQFNPSLEVVDEADDLAYQRSQNSQQLVSLHTKGPLNGMNQIETAEELKFTLLRHWSLDQAMRNSPFVATRLATWTGHGRQRLALLLAKLGLSRQEAQAPYQHLAPQLKQQLVQRMREIGRDYDMGEDARYVGFVRHYGWRKSSVSASDMVQALLALLMSQGGFYRAYDGLGRYEVLREGLREALGLQEKVVGAGVGMLERQAVKTLKSFRLVVLSQDQAHLTDPLVLRQLGLFLMQTLRERSKRRSQTKLPLVLASPLEDGSLVVLGLVALDSPLTKGLDLDTRYSGESRNHFGMVFDQISEELGIATERFFDHSVIVVRRGDLPLFIDKLRKCL